MEELHNRVDVFDPRLDTDPQQVLDKICNLTDIHREYLQQIILNTLNCRTVDTQAIDIAVEVKFIYILILP